MKVLMYGWEFPPFISGGLGIACYGIVQGLIDLGVDLTLVLPRLGDQPQEQDERLTLINALEHNHAGHIQIKAINTLLRPYATPESYQYSLQQQMQNGHHTAYGDDLWAEVHRYADVASQLAKTVEHQAIHAHDWLTILAGVKAKAISGKPLIFHVHALEVDRSGHHICQAVFDIEKFGMEQADVVIAVSNYTKNIIINEYKIPAEKIKVVHNGIFPINAGNTGLARAKPKPIVLFLGRITHQKGPIYFIEAAQKILTYRQDIQFVIAGEGDQLPSIIDKVAALGLGDNIYFTGFLDQDLVKKVYQSSDVYVMPSVSEPFGISCLEALAHNLPVIISKQSGVSEVLSHTLKVDFWDIDALAALIIAAVDLPALRSEMLRNAQIELDRLTWDAAAKKIIEVYKIYI